MDKHKGKYLLRYWGGGVDALHQDLSFQQVIKEIPKLVIKHNGIMNCWFEHKQLRDSFRDCIWSITKRIEKDTQKKCTVVTDSVDEGIDDMGVMIYPSYRTVVFISLVTPDGSEYAYCDDFGYGYSAGSARYMYEEGNYSCDCNRSEFLRNLGVPIDELDCGDTIEMKNFFVAYFD